MTLERNCLKVKAQIMDRSTIYRYFDENKESKIHFTAIFWCSTFKHSYIMCPYLLYRDMKAQLTHTGVMKTWQHVWIICVLKNAEIKCETTNTHIYTNPNTHNQIVCFTKHCFNNSKLTVRRIDWHSEIWQWTGSYRFGLCFTLWIDLNGLGLANK